MSCRAADYIPVLSCFLAPSQSEVFSFFPPGGTAEMCIAFQQAAFQVTEVALTEKPFITTALRGSYLCLTCTKWSAATPVFVY